jgi:Family of unknown function (DUF5677)
LNNNLPPQVKVTPEIIEAYRVLGKLSYLILQLYHEAHSFCGLCAAIVIEGKGGVLDRNQAICGGLLVRIYKFMSAVILLTEGIERGEVIVALSRSIAESAVNLRRLIKGNSELYDKYIDAALGAEREFYDIVKNQIEQQQGEKLPIQEDILSSIQKSVEDSGFDIEQVDRKLKEWGGGVRQRYEVVGQWERHVTEYRIGSHAVHGTWVDLLLHHIRSVDGGFVTNFDWHGSDGRLLSGVACLALEAASDYLDEFFPDVPGAQILLDRIQNLRERILTVEVSREEWSFDEQPGQVDPGS